MIIIHLKEFIHLYHLPIYVVIFVQGFFGKKLFDDPELMTVQIFCLELLMVHICGPELLMFQFFGQELFVERVNISMLQ